MAVTAFTAETMELLGRKNMHDINRLVPGLNLVAGNGVTGDGNPYLPSVGQRETRVTISFGVGIYLGELYIARV